MKARDRLINSLCVPPLIGTVQSVYWTEEQPDHDFSPRRKAASVKLSDGATYSATVRELRAEGWRVKR